MWTSIGGWYVGLTAVAALSYALLLEEMYAQADISVFSVMQHVLTSNFTMIVTCPIVLGMHR